MKTFSQVYQYMLLWLPCGSQVFHFSITEANLSDSVFFLLDPGVLGELPDALTGVIDALTGVDALDELILRIFAAD